MQDTRTRRAAAVALIAAVLGLLPSLPARAAAPRCRAQASECNLEYSPGGRSRRQVLDVYYRTRTAARPRPAVIFVHPGGWWGGSRFDLAGDGFNAPRLAVDRGWVAVNIDYRLGDDPARPGPGDTAVPWRDQPADVAAAVRWVRRNAARYSIDPDRIALVGASAGAHLALLSGLAAVAPGDPARVRAIVSWAAPTDLVSLAAANPCVFGPDGSCTGSYPLLAEMLRRFVGCPLATCPARYRQLSPVALANRRVPPTLLVRGVFDTTVPGFQADELRRALVAAGATAEVADCVVAGSSGSPTPCTHDNAAAGMWAPTVRFLDARLRR